MATSFKQAVNKNLECPICLSFFKDPKNLTCSHTFCKGCLETLLETRGKLLCPTCREETLVPGGDVGRLQPNITVRSLVEDVETQCYSNGNQEDKSLQRNGNKCQKHPKNDEDFFCRNCNKYVCSMCGLLEHAIKDAHTILEAGAHDPDQKNHVEELAAKADAKIYDVDKFVTSVVNQRKTVHNVQEQLNDEIDATFAKSVQVLKERKTVLKNEVKHGLLGKLETSLGDMEESGRKQIDQIKKVLDLVRSGLNFPLLTEALTSHKANCQQLEDLLSRIGLNEELPRRIAKEGEVCFRSQGSDGLQLGQLSHLESKWVLRTECQLPVNNNMSGMVISPNNEMAVGCQKGGIFIYSVEGIIQDTVLKSVQIVALDFMPDGGYVIRDSNNRISMYTEHCEKLDVTLETMVDSGNVSSGLTVGNDGLIFIGYSAWRKIQVFKPEGGKAIREIKCNGYEPRQIVAMTSSQAILVKSYWNMVQVINDVSGAIIHSISKDGENAYPAVYQDNSVIIAWVRHGQSLLSIVQYTKELKYIKNILTDFKIIRPIRAWYYLQAFKKGEIAFCTSHRFYIFHETWE
ncbi:tripartite motif-containing protein 5-like [Strongylocentrotus purpuratus]|uniref:Uncharacterized protein n=1 Tax=Strongylocentrotus purpuratus TaxID=7668 RepID=A0A7M7N744_STRPU|nr:tripartite motif-containing protein 5-like [Strongylocentrotus purpuratus]